MSEEVYLGSPTPGPSVFQLELTPSQIKFLLKKMPQEYKLELLEAREKSIPSPSFSRNASTISLARNASTVSIPKSTVITLPRNISNIEPPVVKIAAPAQPETSTKKSADNIPPPSFPLTRQSSYTPPPVISQATPKFNVSIPSQIFNDKPTSQPVETTKEKPLGGVINPPAFTKKKPVETVPQIHIQPPPSSQSQTQITMSTSTKSSKPMPEEERKQCLDILQSLKRHSFAGPFKLPVDHVALGIPDYPKIIKEPMDLSTVDRILRENRYSSPGMFAADVRKIWTNAMTYNADGSEIYKMAEKMSNYFEKIFKDVKIVAPVIPPPQLQVRVKEPFDMEKQVKKVCKKINTMHHKGGRFTSFDFQSMKYNVLKNQIMTQTEKETLYMNIHNLPSSYLKGVWDFVNEELPPEKKNKEVVDFDLETLATETLRRLERFVNYKITQIKKTKAKKAKVASRKEAEMMAQKMLKTENGAEKKPVEQPEEFSSASSYVTDSDEGGEDEMQ